MVRDALRSLEERKVRLEALRRHLGEGADQARSGKFTAYSPDRLLAALDAEGE